jgi:hypothetical protein
MTATQEVAAVIVAIAALLGALGYIARWVRNLVHGFDRLAQLGEKTAATVDRELTKNSGSSIKDQVGRLPGDVARLDRKVERGGEKLAAAILADLDAHSHQGRVAVALWRKALADQGIHLPVVPGEDGYLDEQHPTHREDHHS